MKTAFRTNRDRVGQLQGKEEKKLDFSFGFTFFGVFLWIVFTVITLLVWYLLIKAAVGNSKITTEVYALRNDLNELERRQTERFAVLDTHMQEQNELLREQNELLRRGGS